MLRDVYWVGGGSGSGKSTVARRLAAAYGLRVYDTDAVMGDHARRSTAADCPQLAAFLAMDMDERWVNRSPATMLETFHWFRGEGFGFVVDDLCALAAGGPVVADGFRLLPRLVAPLLADRRQAVWLLPAPEFRRVAFEARGSLWQIAGRTSDPPRALANLLERDARFTERLRAETRELGLTSVDVDGSSSADHLVARVAGLLGLDDATPR